MISNKNSNVIIFLISSVSIFIVVIISSNFLFSIDSSEKQELDEPFSGWSRIDRNNWLSDCLSIGRDEETCNCMLDQLENMYDSKKKMNLEMKEDPVKFSQSMISAKTGCN